LLLKGFRYEVHGAGIEAREHGFFVAGCGDHQDRHARVVLARPLGEGEAIAVGQVEVERDHVVNALHRGGLRVAFALHPVHFVAFFFEGETKALTERRVIFYK